MCDRIALKVQRVLDGANAADGALRNEASTEITILVSAQHRPARVAGQTFCVQFEWTSVTRLLKNEIFLKEDLAVDASADNLAARNRRAAETRKFGRAKRCWAATGRVLRRTRRRARRRSQQARPQQESGPAALRDEPMNCAHVAPPTARRTARLPINDRQHERARRVEEAIVSDCANRVKGASAAASELGR